MAIERTNHALVDCSFHTLAPLHTIPGSQGFLLLLLSALQMVPDLQDVCSLHDPGVDDGPHCDCWTTLTTAKAWAGSSPWFS